ncbi:NADPH-dependent FMN reductase [Burkholderiaceae bacterium UC74_6]
MAPLKIAVIVGSLRRDSNNRKLARALEALVPSDVVFKHVDIGKLPLYSQDDDDHPAPPVVTLRDDIRACQGVMFVTAEYNRSVPGVLKNALDHGSRPYGQSVWEGKPAGVIGVSVGAIGTALAQAHLRQILAYLDMPTLGQPEVFLKMSEGLIDKDGHVAPDSKKFLQGWMDKFLAWVRTHGHKQPEHSVAGEEDPGSAVEA